MLHPYAYTLPPLHLLSQAGSRRLPVARPLRYTASAQLSVMTPIGPLLRAAALLTLQLTACSAFDAASFKLPPGFSISVWADNLPNARSLAVSNVKKYSIVFVGSRGAGPNPASGTPDDKVRTCASARWPPLQAALRALAGCLAARRAPCC